VVSQPSPLEDLPEGVSQDSASVARLHGRWLVVVRVACIAVAIIALVVWAIGVPLRYSQLGTLCTVAPASCGDQQITPNVFQLFTAAGVPLSFYSGYIGTIEVLYALSYLVMGGLLLWRKSDTRIGLLTAILLITYGVAQTDGDTVATTVRALALPAGLLDPFSFACLGLFLYLFPDGRFVPRWGRWVLVIWIPLFLIVSAISIQSVVPILFSFIFVSLGMQIYRYRRVSTPVERQQTKWVVFGLLVGILGSGGIIVAGLLFYPGQRLGLPGLFVANTLIYMFSACIPLSIGVAILRSRLWDIDTLINRALVYGSLTGLLGLLYGGLIVGLERLASLVAGPRASSPLTLVISTLVIAALFQPLRRRIQAFIDRAFYRQKYDAAQTLAAFGRSLGQEVDLEQIREHLLVVTSQTLQPAHLSLWLRSPSPPHHPPAESASPVQLFPAPSGMEDSAAPRQRSTQSAEAHHGS
jgi:hypothetical protein